MAKKVNPATAAARSELIAISELARMVLDGDIQPDWMDDMALEDMPVGINEVLLIMHRMETGCSQFQTFKQWQEQGYKVKKGSKAFRVWGSPIRASKGAEPEADKKTDTEGDDQKYKFWPMCCLFNESQIEASQPEGK